MLGRNWEEGRWYGGNNKRNIRTVRSEEKGIVLERGREGGGGI